MYSTTRICFVLLWFSSLNAAFSGENLITHWKTKQLLEKSMPLALIEKEGIELSLESHRESLYLDAVEQYIQTH